MSLPSYAPRLPCVRALVSSSGPGSMERRHVARRRAFRRHPARSATASAAEVAPVVDGNVLDDKAWATAKVISGFWQTTPDEGQPASENTEVRVLYTSECCISASSTTTAARAHHQRRQPARRDVDQHRQLPRGARHISRSAERLRVRYKSRRHRIRRAGDGRGAGQRWWRRRWRWRWRWWRRWWRWRRWWWRWWWWWWRRWRWTGRRVWRRVQYQLGWVVAGPFADARERVERGVRHSVPHPALSVARRAGVGHQFPAQHPASQ